MNTSVLSELKEREIMAQKEELTSWDTIKMNPGSLYLSQTYLVFFTIEMISDLILLLILQCLLQQYKSTYIRSENSLSLKNNETFAFMKKLNKIVSCFRLSLEKLSCRSNHALTSFSHSPSIVLF